ncbi:prephenate dehydratase [Chromatiales bacterium (ex Bugula neritina AB1)]|nr:prephenate dehydratase [Chromatiales bacterium (ex Bugula neritina AB1)]
MSDYKNKIAYQGEAGAYSHLASRNAHPELEPFPCESFAAAFAAVENRQAGLAIIPIENSLGGRVADMHYLLPESTLFIVDEYYHAVQHCLLGLPGATLEGLTHVRSHPQGLAQCRGIIEELNLKVLPVADTAGSAREVKELGDPAHASIASSLAGEIYGLSVLRDRIEDRVGNTTRFVVLSKSRIEPDPETPCMTSLVFHVRSVPAALYKSLGGFATNGVNITKLESYMTDERFQVARFYVELEGHPLHENVDNAIQELQYYSTELRVLGTYPANIFRRQAAG